MAPRCSATYHREFWARHARSNSSCASFHQPRSTGSAITCARTQEAQANLLLPVLIERLAVLQATSGARVILVAEYDAHVWDNPAVATRQRNIAGKTPQPCRAMRDLRSR